VTSSYSQADLTFGIDTRGMTDQDCLDALVEIQSVVGSARWVIGDLALSLKRSMGEDFSVRWLAEQVGMSSGDLSDCMSAAELLGLEVREEVLGELGNLTWTHYMYAARYLKHRYPGFASKDEEERTRLALRELGIANENEMTTREFAAHLRGLKASERLYRGEDARRVLVAAGLPVEPDYPDYDYYLTIKAVRREGADD